MSSPKIYTNPGDAPFTEAFTIDMAHLAYSDRKALCDGLKLELLGMVHEPFHAFYATDKLVCMDATDTVVGQLTALCKRWENRHSIKVEACKLPRIPLRARIMAWLDPTHEAPRSLHRLGNVHKKGSRYYFECEMHSTQSDTRLIRTMHDVVKSPSCKGSKLRVRGRVLTIKAKTPDAAHRVWSCAQRLNFDRIGSSPAICPAMLWLASVS